MIHTTFFYSPIPLPYNGTDIKDTARHTKPPAALFILLGALDSRLFLFFFTTIAVISPLQRIEALRSKLRGMARWRIQICWTALYTVHICSTVIPCRPRGLTINSKIYSAC
jgi:hypothetical protein